MRSFIFICFTNFACLTTYHGVRHVQVHCTVYTKHEKEFASSQSAAYTECRHPEWFWWIILDTVGTIRMSFRTAYEKPPPAQNVEPTSKITRDSMCCKGKKYFVWSPKEIYELRPCKCACGNRLWNGRIHSHHISQREDELRSSSSHSFSKFSFLALIYQ